MLVNDLLHLREKTMATVAPNGAAQVTCVHLSKIAFAKSMLPKICSGDTEQLLDAAVMELTGVAKLKDQL